MRSPHRVLATACAALALALTSLGGAHAVPVGYDFVHDPSLIRQGNAYYLYSTGAPDGVIGNGAIQVRSSTDLRHWRYRGTVFGGIPSWVTSIVGPIPNLWAPDISYWRGAYHLYFAGSSFGTNISVIGLATNSTLDPGSPRYHWVDRGLVVQSLPGDDWNAIDPSLAFDASGTPWLAFGSFWGGIKLRRIEPSTGKPSATDTTLYPLAYRPGSNAIEAPIVVYRAPFYYLFVSIDRCCQGADSTYRIAVGRALHITGPYLDRRGASMADGAFDVLLSGHGRYRGPGGESVIRDGDRYLLAYHYYDADAGGAARLGIDLLTWDGAGWPGVGRSIAP